MRRPVKHVNAKIKVYDNCVKSDPWKTSIFLMVILIVGGQIFWMFWEFKYQRLHRIIKLRAIKVIDVWTLSVTEVKE